MFDVFETLSRNKLAWTYRLQSDSPAVNELIQKVKDDSFNFSLNKFKVYDGRLVTQFEELSVENVILLHIKNQLKRIFRVSFANRNKVIDELFNNLQVARSLKDFTIAKFDFKEYFYNVSTDYVNEEYILKSNISRKDKDYINKLCTSNPYCVPGLPVFNYFVEIVSRDFDDTLKTALMKYGLVYYARYVDDGIFILNHYLSKSDIKKLINNSIDAVFKNTSTRNRVRLNSKKFEVINRRHLENDNSFDFLGYEFFIKAKFSKLTIGLTQNKMDKYQSKVNELIKNTYKAGDKKSEQIIRHMIKAHSSRVVYRSSSKNKPGVWIAKGIIANYNKLRDYPTYIDPKTKHFMNNIYISAFKAAGVSAPEYLKNPRYSLYNNMVANRAMIFNELIGMPKKQLIRELDKLGDKSKTDDDPYDQILAWYLISIKIGY